MASVSICFTAGCLPSATCAHSRLCRAHVRALVGSIALHQVRCSPVGLPGSPPPPTGAAQRPAPPRRRSLEFEAVPWELGVYLQLQHQVMFLRKASRLRGKRGPQSRILATPLRPPPRPCPRPSSFVLWTWAGGSRGTISPPPVPSPPPSGPHPTPCPVAALNHRPHHYLKIL